MQTIRTNLKNNASSQYTNFPFTSFCVFNGVIIGAGSSGLFKACCGDDDNGININAHVVPVETDYGMHEEKNLRYAYISGKCSTSLNIHITDDTGVTLGPYVMTPVSISTTEQRRVTLARGAKSVFSTTKISNVAGGSFSLNAVKFYIDANIHANK